MAEEPNSMKILEICRVAPANPLSHFSLPFTFLDMIWLEIHPTSRLFFYELSPQNTQTDFSLIFLPKLKHSLSLVLQHYLPLAGNLTWPQDSDTPILQYHIGDGVSLTIAETQADFHLISGDEFRPAVELRSLLPDFPTSETQTPAMTLQITIFPNKGFSIGYVAHHGVMDGKSVSMFMHSWAYVCKNGDETILPSELIPCYDRTLVEEHQTELERVYPKGFFDVQARRQSKTVATFEMNPPPPDSMLGTFRLTRENTQALKKSILSNLEEREELETATPISTFTTTSAYAMVCLLKAKKIWEQKVFIGINVDGRARLHPPLPSTYFGNCILNCGGGGDGKDFVLEDGLLMAVKVITQALAVLNEEPVKIAENFGALMSYIMENVRTGQMTGFAIAGSPRFELYKVDFGWGRPRKVEMISIDKGEAFYLSDDRDGKGGIEVGIALKKQETEDFATLFANGLQA